MVKPNPRTIKNTTNLAIAKARARLGELGEKRPSILEKQKAQKKELKDIEKAQITETGENIVSNSLDNFVEGNLSPTSSPTSEDFSLRSGEVQSVSAPEQNLETSLSNVSTDLGSSDRGSNLVYQNVYTQGKQDKFYDDNFAEGRKVSERVEAFSSSGFREFQNVPRVDVNARNVDTRDLAFDPQMTRQGDVEEKFYEPNHNAIFRQDEMMSRTSRDIEDMRFKKYNPKDLNNSVT